MTQQNARGAYVNFEHDRAADWDWLLKWQPNVIRYMGQGKPNDPNSFDVNRVKRIHDTCPDATILLRCWEVDDNNFKAHDAMVSNPRAEAERQVDWWAKVFDRAVGVGIPRQLLMAGLNNETGPEKDGALYPYTEAALQFGTQKAVRLGVFVFSVGRPSLEGEAQYTISTFSKLDNAILANNGAVLLHEYLQPEGMYCVWIDENGNERKDYTYLVGRHARWQIKSPIIIGEWGIDGILYNRHADPGYGNSGWRNFPQDWTPDRYADEYVECVQKSSDNVIGICPFISDPSDKKWFSFDPLPAYGALLARKDRCVKDVAATTPTQPQPAPTSPVAVVNVPNGGNIRTGPGREYPVRGAEPFGTPMPIVGKSATDSWYYIDLPHIEGWVSASVVDARNTDNVPVVEAQPVTPAPEQPQPVGDTWARSRAFVAKWEGDYSDNPEDHGNWTGGRKGQGELKGTRYGISAASYPGLDIRNLTMQQADEIYFRDFWQASGADKLPWPYCLLAFDTAVLHGVGASRKWQTEAGDNPLAFAAKRLRSYTKLDNWNVFGAGWVNRVSDLLVEASK